MRVLITGGTGLIGQAVATRLLQQGHEVHLTDLVQETDAPHTTYAVCDVTDFEAVRQQMDGCDAVVHMAALRSPFYGPGQEVFRVNTLGTFNVFEAATKVKIRRVVQASSINALGCAWNITDFSPRYLPIDEDHPQSTSDPYSFSKQQVEEIGAYFWRRDNISSIALRFPGIYPAGYLESAQHIENRDAMCEFLDDFVQLPRSEQQEKMSQARRQSLAFRAARNLEDSSTFSPATPPEGINRFLWRAWTYDRFNLWAALDVRDAALAVEQSLNADFEGSHNVFVSDIHNSLHYPSRTLARLFFPEVTHWKQALTDSRSLVNITRARDLLGFEPFYSKAGGYRAETR